MSRSINRIIVHHSEGRTDTFEVVKNWHTTKDDPDTPKQEGMGWAHVAYHFVIEQNGKIYSGASEKISAGGTKQSSADALEVCLCGNFDAQTPTPAALSRLQALLTNWCKSHQLVPSDTTIVGHKDVQPKKGTKDNTCPGGNLYSLLPQLRTTVHGAVFANGSTARRVKAL